MDVFDNYVNEVADCAAGGWLENLAIITVLEDFDDILVFKGLKGLHLTGDSLTSSFGVLLKEVIPYNLDRNHLVGLKSLPEVYL